MVPMNTPGVKLISRASYENAAAVMGTPVRLPAFEQTRRERCHFCTQFCLHPLGGCIRLRRYREGQQLLPQNRLFAPRHASGLHKAGRQA